ncbi:MAG: hypothetical protein GTO60_16635 [Gammaproteobacteria bacterium]|nr:hypothetical protein [Gammaproteobacteria bacterium]
MKRNGRYAASPIADIQWVYGEHFDDIDELIAVLVERYDSTFYIFDLETGRIEVIVRSKAIYRLQPNDPNTREMNDGIALE